MLNIGNKTLRNLPEQVGYLTTEVSKIWEALDGLDVYDNVIILENLNPLTPAQLEIINKPVAFIVYNNTLYMKRGVGVNEVYFDSVFQVAESGGVISFNSSEITVTEPLGTVAITNTSTSSYSKDEEDSLLNAKADISAVLDLIFPVNSVFISTANTSPAGLIGGSWEALNSGNEIYLPDANKLEVYPGDSQSFDNRPGLEIKTTNGQSSLIQYALVGIDTNNILRNFTNSIGSGSANTAYLTTANLWAQNAGVAVYMWRRAA